MTGHMATLTPVLWDLLLPCSKVRRGIYYSSPFHTEQMFVSADFLLRCSSPGTNQCFGPVIIICGITLLTHDIEGKASLDERPIFLETCQYKLRGRQRQTWIRNFPPSVIPFRNTRVVRAGEGWCGFSPRLPDGTV